MQNVEELIEFYRIYCKFLSIDLFLSMRPAKADAEGYRGGRNFILLYKFFEIFYNIYLEELDISTRHENLKSLNSAIDEYIRTSQKSIGLASNLQCEKINIDNKNDLLKIFEPKNKEIFKKFYQIVKIFKKHINGYPEIKSHFSGRIKEPVLGQGMIEFHNAMSHLTFVAREKENSNSNVEKALAHIYRGTIDNMKSIIKNLKLDDEEKKLIIDIRAEEFNLLGCNIKLDEYNIEHDKKSIIINKYEKLVLSLLSGFPRNKFYTEAISTRVELQAKVLNNKKNQKK